MNGTQTRYFLMVIALMIILLTACSPQQTMTMELASADQPAVETLVATNIEEVEAEEVQTAPTSVQRCARPKPEDMTACQTLEAEILASTVRLELNMNTAGDTAAKIGHATIVHGRYLFTHNHFGVALADFHEDVPGMLTVSRPDGTIIVDAAPFKAFDVLVATPELLIFDFGPYGGAGLFGMLGLSSAKFDTQQVTTIRPGMEVAQIDWNGSTAHIDWVAVREVRTENGLPVVVLNNFVEQGASGGGIFFEGVHLGNNWFRQTVEAADGRVLDRYTVVALNPSFDFAALDSAGVTNS